MFFNNIFEYTSQVSKTRALVKSDLQLCLNSKV